jgi:hypothetical protein
MTNAEVIAVNQRGLHPRPVATGNYPVWVSDHLDSSNVKYVAMVNCSGATYTVTLTLSSIGFTTCTARNLWTKTDIGSFTTTFAQSLATHASGLYKLTGPASSVASVHPPAVHALSERIFIVTGGKLLMPRDYAGTAAVLSVYDMRGKLLRVITVKEGAVNIHEKFGAAQSVYIVRIKPIAQ